MRRPRKISAHTIARRSAAARRPRCHSAGIACHAGDETGTEIKHPSSLHDDGLASRPAASRSGMDDRGVTGAPAQMAAQEIAYCSGFGGIRPLTR